MRDIADYFRPRGSSSISSQFESEVQKYDNHIANRRRKRIHKKRKHPLSSDSDTDIQHAPSENRKRKSLPKVDNDKKYPVNDNIRVHLTRIDARSASRQLKKKHSLGDNVQLASVLLEDCFDLINEKQYRSDNCEKSLPDRFSSKKLLRHSSNRKGKPIKYDLIESNDSDLSDSIFGKSSLSKNTLTKLENVDNMSKSLLTENSSLLNCFEAEKRNLAGSSPISASGILNSQNEMNVTDDSSVKPPEIFEAAAVVHSSASKEVKENQHLIVYLNKMIVPSYGLDQVTAVPTKTEVEKSSVPRKSECSKLSRDDDESTGNLESSLAKIRPWKMRVQFAHAKKLYPLRSLEKKKKEEKVSLIPKSMTKSNSLANLVELMDNDEASADKIEITAEMNNKIDNNVHVSHSHQLKKKQKKHSPKENVQLACVLLKDCSNRIDEKRCRSDDCDESLPDRFSSEKSSRHVFNQKQKPVEYNLTESNDSDSSDSVFVRPSELSKNTSTKLKNVDKMAKSSSNEKSSLLNYFKTEKRNSFESSPINTLGVLNSQNKMKLSEDSPVKLPEIFDAIAVVHSPPKSPSTRTRRSKEVKENAHPIIRLTRAILPFNDLDQITVVSAETEIKKSSLPPKKEYSELGSDIDELAGNSESPLASITPWKMRVQFAHPKNLYQSKNPKRKKKKEKVAHISKTRKKSNSSANLQELRNIAEDSADEMEVNNKLIPMDNLPKTTSKKLAPLFCKRTESKEEKNLIKYTQGEAKRLFLESGVPMSVRRKMKKQKSTPDDNSFPIEYTFPNVSHVQQKDLNCFVWTLSKVINTRMKPLDDAPIESKIELFSGFLDRDDSSRNSIACDESKFDIKEEIENLKKMEPKVDVSNIYLNVKKLSKKAADGENACWTEKYKPTSYLDMIGNGANLTKLKQWIETHKNLKFKSTEGGNTSSEEFIDSDNSSGDTRIRNTIAILVGPPGCGKTCAVYTLANELGYNVLEVNTASNRNGKRILDELLEATQSHRVERPNIFNEKSPKKTKKMKRNKKEEKKTMSLILIENADVLFDNHDEGFTSALNTLTAESKRPMIFTLNDINRPHLSRYNNARNLILKFTYPSRSSLNVWLKSIALNEGVKLTDNALMHLFQVAGLDFRKNLLQLQLMISSKKTFEKLDQEELFHITWWEHVNHLKRMNIEPIKYNKQKRSVFSEDDEFKSDNLFNESNVNASQPIKYKPEDLKALERCSNLSEKISRFGISKAGFINERIEFLGADENAVCDFVDRHAASLSEDIADFIRKRIFQSYQYNDHAFSFKKYHDKFKEVAEMKILCKNVFNDFKTPCMEGLSRYCDYLPAVREIARIERNKIRGETFCLKICRKGYHIKAKFHLLSVKKCRSNSKCKCSCRMNKKDVVKGHSTDESKRKQDVCVLKIGGQRFVRPIFKLKKNNETQKQRDEKQNEENHLEVDKNKRGEIRINKQKQAVQCKEYKIKGSEELQEYYISDLTSESSSDDEEKPKSQIPSWATKVNRKRPLMCQAWLNKEETILKWFHNKNFKNPQMERLFGKNIRSRPRTSSAVWCTPVSCDSNYKMEHFV